MKVYIDDMLMKSFQVEDYLQYLEELSIYYKNT